jgi:hypothetical protein
VSQHIAGAVEWVAVSMIPGSELDQDLGISLVGTSLKRSGVTCSHREQASAIA